MSDDIPEELLAIADAANSLGARGQNPAVKQPLDALEEAAETIGKSWSNSWLGYQAFVYYEGLRPAPPGAHFSQEWGGQQRHTIRTTTGAWCEFDPEVVENRIRKLAKNPDLTAAKELAFEATKAFQAYKSECLSLLTVALATLADSYLETLQKEIQELRVITTSDFIEFLQPKGTVMTRDTLALTQGYRTPPHISVLADVIGLRGPPTVCTALGIAARRAGSHLARKQRQRRRLDIIGTNVAIGHGRSLVWRELKDFVQDRLNLPVDEFNRVPIAGIANITRLSEMIDGAAIAFLVLTAEDEQVDGTLNPRMNVVHEAGLFQGRLGFTKGIILLEEGCAEFSNIHGLGQIRFQKNNIKATFEEIRQVLEREGIIRAS
jgi:hypothetical protein